MRRGERERWGGGGAEKGREGEMVGGTEMERENIRF